MVENSDVPARRNSYAASMEANLNLFDPSNIQSPFDSDPSQLSNTYANGIATLFTLSYCQNKQPLLPKDASHLPTCELLQ